MNIDKIEININEPANLESQIVNQILINYASVLDFALLYKMENETTGRSSSTENVEYVLKESTIGLRDISFLELIQQLQRFYTKDKGGRIRFEKLGKTLLVEKEHFQKQISVSALIECKSKKGYNQKGQTKPGRIKLFNFNKLAIGGIRNGTNIIILGFRTENDKQTVQLKASLPAITGEIDAKCNSELWHYNQIDRDLREIDRDKNNLTTQMVDSFKAISQPGQKNAIHLFRFSGYDNRLYYSYLDNAILDADDDFDWKNYPAVEESENNRLSPNQINYAVSNIHKKFIDDKDVRAEAELVLRNIHNTKFLQDFLASKDDKKKWLLAWVISCIPQEPWTGVAGYTLQTKSIDYSRVDGETRWDPNMLNPAYYYSKLMVYERLIGVGGKHGKMIAYPIMDCGQVAGVLFSNSKSGGLPEIGYLQKFLGLSHAFKNVISSNRQLEFLQGTMDDLLQGQGLQIYPIIPILKNIPKLLNTPLVVVWESEADQPPIRPRYIYGYQTSKIQDFSMDEGLMPMQFSEFDDKDTLFDKLGLTQFRHLELLENGLISGEEIPNILSNQFVYEYRQRTIDGAPTDPKTGLDHKLIHSIAYSLGGAYVHRYRIKEKNGWIVIFFNEDHTELEEHIEALTFKMKHIGLVINQTDALSYLATNKELNLHRLRPINDIVNRALDKAHNDLGQLRIKLGSEMDQELLNGVLARIGLAQLFNQNLKDKLGRLDSKNITADYRPSEHLNLMANLNEIWLMTTYCWEGASNGGNLILYQQNAKCVIEMEHNGTLISYQLGHICHDPRLNELSVFAPRLDLLLIFENLFSNSLNGSVISAALLESDTSRATIKISIKPFDNDFYEIIVTDRGTGMDLKTLRWVEDIIDYAVKNDDNVHSRELQDQYDKLKSGKEHSPADGRGFGIRVAASTLQGIYRNYQINGQYKLKILNTSKEGTSMTFLLPKNEF